MRAKGRGLFIKTFLYTLLFILVVIGIAVFMFSGQITTAFQAGQNKVHEENFAPLINQIEEGSPDQIAAIAASFEKDNVSPMFYLKDGSDKILYHTPALVSIPDNEPVESVIARSRVVDETMQPESFAVIPLPDGITLFVATTPSGDEAFMDFVRKSIFAIVLLLAVSVLGAALFARGITKPIKQLASDSTKMASLEFVPPPTLRKDEIGQLSADVYSMYERLKDTIAELEIEIQREREMEESQRYFFTAASHELKTPIASTLILLQGMIDEIEEYQDHPKYLKECVKKMQAQSKTISKMLEIVKLSNSGVEPQWESIDLGVTLQTVVDSCLPLAEAKGQSISVSVPEATTCQTDRDMILRVLSNIILNTVQNSPEQSEVRVWIKAQSKDTVRLSILNTNVSIDKDTLPKLFEPFYREGSTHDSIQGRSGLGLTIVKRTLDYLEIPFSLENADDGVLFWMDLPV